MRSQLVGDSTSVSIIRPLFPFPCSSSPPLHLPRLALISSSLEVNHLVLTRLSVVIAPKKRGGHVTFPSKFERRE